MLAHHTTRALCLARVLDADNWEYMLPEATAGDACFDDVLVAKVGGEGEEGGGGGEQACMCGCMTASGRGTASGWRCFSWGKGGKEGGSGSQEAQVGRSSMQAQLRFPRPVSLFSTSPPFSPVR
jgi:hypothetical protein